MIAIELWRRLSAEFVGTAALVTAVVGSGVMASRLSPLDAGLQLLECSTTVALALATLVLVLGPISGAHLNPVVSLADWFLGRGTRVGLAGGDLAWYVIAQVSGSVCGSVLANLMFGLPAVQLSATDRLAKNLWLGEVVATAGLILLVFALARAGRAAAMPAAVGAYIGSACWFTSSTSFANPAVTVGRVFTDTSSGIAAGSVAAFVGAQCIGMAIGIALLRALYPVTAQTAGRVLADAVAGQEECGRGCGAGRGRSRSRRLHGATLGAAHGWTPPHRPGRGAPQRP
ncbi:aquaporin [Dactylosporangium sp. NBC_01737]|uniref:aquaporin n=1 Tax=Dactylosporangium sp. NBC_01737 TaxID=2975959 RepID=UPI003FA372C0